jgi:hypothetical protein
LPRATSDDEATAYARAVADGRLVSGPHVRASCARHLRDVAVAEGRGLRWDVAAVERALGFFPDILRLSEGQFEGEPFVLQPSQKFIIGSISDGSGKTGPGASAGRTSSREKATASRRSSEASGSTA